MNEKKSFSESSSQLENASKVALYELSGSTPSKTSTTVITPQEMFMLHMMGTPPISSTIKVVSCDWKAPTLATAVAQGALGRVSESVILNSVALLQLPDVSFSSRVVKILEGVVRTNGTVLRKYGPELVILGRIEWLVLAAVVMSAIVATVVFSDDCVVSLAISDVVSIVVLKAAADVVVVEELAEMVTLFFGPKDADLWKVEVEFNLSPIAVVKDCSF